MIKLRNTAKCSLSDNVNLLNLKIGQIHDDIDIPTSLSKIGVPFDYVQRIADIAQIRTLTQTATTKAR